MVKRIWPIMLIYLVIGGLWIIVVWYYVPPAGNVDNFFKTAGVGLSLVTGVMGSHIAIQNARMQSATVIELEKLRTEHTKLIAEHQKQLNEQVERLKSDLQRDIEMYKSQLANRSEELKEFLRKESNAYDQLVEAAYLYFRTLEKSFQYQWSMEEIEKADQEMSKVERFATLVPEDYRNAWFKFWQYGHNMVRRTKSKTSSIAPKDVWANGQQSFRNSFNDLVDLQKSLSKLKSNVIP